MPRTRKIGPRPHKASGVYYVTLPDGSFKYFCKDPEETQRQYTAWLAGDYNSSAPRGKNRPDQEAVGSTLTTVWQVFNAYLAFLKEHRESRIRSPQLSVLSR